MKKKWFLYVCMLLCLFFVFLLLHETLFVKKPPMLMGRMQMKPGFRGEFELFRPERGNSVFLFIVIIMISGGIRIVEEWIKSEKKAKQIENDRMTMELSFLRSQINPHFLFNTLNNIYTLALMKSDNAADAVMKLSDIMRYMTEDSTSNFVSLEKEVDYIKHYVELQKIRLGENIDIILDFLGDFEGLEIPPLILIPFVENAFKHGISSHAKVKIIIKLKIQGKSLEFKITNQIFRERIQKSATGLGLKNTKKRLELLYPGRFSLDINDKHGIFSVDLKIRML